MTNVKPKVALLLEGTYPYVSGGVSSWVHDLIGGLEEVPFSLFHIAARDGVALDGRYKLPGNVTGITNVFCAGGTSAALDAGGRERLQAEIRSIRKAAKQSGGPSRLIAGLRQLHLGGTVDREMIENIASADRDLMALLHGREAFELVCELADTMAPDAPFLDFFWHFRAMHLPVLRLLHGPRPDGDVLHALSTGYAGLVGAVASVRSGRPLLLTEHGIYARERDMELARATWLQDTSSGAKPEGIEQIRLFWSRFFTRLSQIAYTQASTIVTLSEVNRRKQLTDCAPAPKIRIVPNGVDLDAITPQAIVANDAPGRPLRVGFVGRVVPIKDVLTLIRACHIALQSVALDVELIGPDAEDPSYSNRCRALVAQIGRQSEIRFVGPRPAREIYANLDVVVLTSHSEGQPLVILEAYAANVPVIATDVGACREMIEGRTEIDRQLGPSGIVTHIATPTETAAALVKLARDPALRRKMGAAGRLRAGSFYRRDHLIDAYRGMYSTMAESP